MPEGNVETRRLTAILFVERPDALVSSLVFRQHLPGRIGGPVIAHQQFPMAVGLCQYAIQGIAQKCCAVVGRHEHGDQKLPFQPWHVDRLLVGSRNGHSSELKVLDTDKLSSSEDSETRIGN